MKNNIILIFLSQSFLLATFSIVALDTYTGEVGSAGGSCIANSIIISDIHPGQGAIHTQSYWMSANQIYASSLMEEGYTPNEIIDFLQENDIQNNPSIRQYGIVAIDSGNNYGNLYEDECNEIGDTYWNGTSSSGQLGECTDIPISGNASFTGENCSDWKGHINGIDYAIQGNILLNEDILNQMEYNFLITNGTLDRKLMSAMQGAKIPGADTRCLDEGISTLSAFIRLAKPNDDNTYYIDLNVNSVIPYYSQTGLWLDPIDTLQILYDEWYNNTFPFELGDINQDTIIDILDIVQLVNFIMGNNISGIEFYLADLNADNTVNIQDIIIIINYILSHQSD